MNKYLGLTKGKGDEARLFDWMKTTALMNCRTDPLWIQIGLVVKVSVEHQSFERIRKFRITSVCAAKTNQIWLANYMEHRDISASTKTVYNVLDSCEIVELTAAVSHRCI